MNIQDQQLVVFQNYCKRLKENNYVFRCYLIPVAATGVIQQSQHQYSHHVVENQLLKSDRQRKHVKKMDTKNHLFLTLMKLKLNLHLQS